MGTRDPATAPPNRGRLLIIGRPNAEILHHYPPPAYVRTRPSEWVARSCWRLGGRAGRARRRAGV